MASAEAQDMIGEVAALDAIFAAFAEPVRYIHADGAVPIDDFAVVWSDSPGPAFQGLGETTREVTAEIRRGSVPGKPGRDMRIERNGITWKLNQVDERDDVDAYVVTLELA